MEVETKTSIPENLNKTPEDGKLIENQSIKIDAIVTDDKNHENMAESSKVTKDSKETPPDSKKLQATETKDILEIVKAPDSVDSVKTYPGCSAESEQASALSLDASPKEKTSDTQKITSEIQNKSLDDNKASMALNKNSQGHAINKETEIAGKLEAIVENVPETSEASPEVPKSEIQEKTTGEVISGSSVSPEVSRIGENARIMETEEEDLENGQEEDEEEDEDEINEEEIVEAEEEGSASVDRPEVGIVGPPTAVRDLVNDEELGTTESSSLPSETRNNETSTGSNNGTPDVAGWIERSRLTNNKEKKITVSKTSRRRKKSSNEVNSCGAVGPSRKSQKIVTSIIRRSIKCLNKMHAAAEYGSGGTAAKKTDSSEKREEDSRGSPKVPQSRQNGAALPEETATAMATSASLVNSERLRPVVKSENQSDTENEGQSTPIIDLPRSRRRSIDEIPTDSRNSCKKTSAQINVTRSVKNERDNGRKRRSTDDPLSTNSGQPFTKKICFEQRERFIDSLIGTSERISADELADRADQLRAEVQALDELARAKEMEWNEILSMRKLKEEAYLRIERRRQVVGYMESNGQLSDNLPPASLTLIPEWESTTAASTIGENSTRITSQDSVSSRDVKEIEDVRLIEASDSSQRLEEARRDVSPVHSKREKINVAIKSSSNVQRSRTSSPKQLAENGRKHQQRGQQQQNQQQQQQQRHQQQLSEQQSLDNRQIGEGRQGPIVDVRSIIADYRLRHPESVPKRYDSKRDSPARPRDTTTTTTTTNTRTSGLINVRRGRRMRNSVNISLGAGGAMVETTVLHNVDSRPSSTDSCKSSNERIPNNDANTNSMSFKDVLVQFAKLSQQQGEPVKTPQNYPDVTLHPVAPTTVTINSTPTQQNTGSLLHGILTKSQSPRPTTFSPTLARLLTAPERERTNAPTSITAIPQQNIQTQHLLQTYQGSNPVSISDLLSSSKARTEITITPVVTPMTPSHTSQSNSLVHVDDVEEESSLLDERDSRLGSGGRDNRDDRDSPPRCQGCQEQAAQFVCAGCGNQWYCSRDCQVAAWDEHSEVCSG